MGKSVPSQADIEKFVRENLVETDMVCQLIKGKNLFIAHESLPPSDDYIEVRSVKVGGETYVILRRKRGVPKLVR